jgi:hypothetical protein
MLSSRLTELAVLEDQIRQGHMLAVAEGPVLVDPTADPEKDPGLATRGRILGGAVATKSRSLGLMLGQQFKMSRMSIQIAGSINKRFYAFVNGRRQGLATPKTDEFLDLAIHPRYKDNVARYMQVVRNVAIDESPGALQARLLFLEQQLLDPVTAASAAIRLEAIGDDQAKTILRDGIASGDAEVRFYAAEALAYLDDTAAVKGLAQTIREEPPFRVNALAALSAMDDVVAYDALCSLLEAKSAETRYGAFRALWAMNEYDPFVRGEWLGEQFSYHVLDIPGPKMVHVTRSFRPEVVLFGKDQHFQLPLVLDAGKNILINGQSGGTITVSRFKAGAEPEQRVVSTDVNEVVRAIVDLGGTYPDVVQALHQAKTDGAIESRLLVDALPEVGRPYDRSVRTASAAEELSGATDTELPLEVSSPAPNLFPR